MKRESCLGCPIVDHGTDFSEVEGSGKNGVLVVAEASGAEEAASGLPLRPWAMAGGLFERVLRRLGLDRNDFAITNMCRCRPRGNLLSQMPFESRAVHHCSPNLVQAYTRLQPRVILALGGIAFDYLTGLGGHGQTISHLRGYVFAPSPSYSPTLATDADLRGAVIVPTYHPSFIRRGSTHLFGVLARDVMRAVNISLGKDHSYLVEDPLMALYRDELQYQLKPTIDDAWAYYHKLRDRPESPISYDLETVESESLDEDQREQFSDTRIRQTQLSVDESEGIALPWNDEFRKVWVAVMNLPNPKIGWNCFYKNTSVWMADGTWKPIHAVKAGEFVRSKMGEQVVASEVVNLVRVKDDRPWVEVRVDGAYNRGVGRWGNTGVVCTGDHEWFTPNGKKEAYLLRAGDEVFLPRLGHSDVISGTLHGDGSTDRRGRLAISHSNALWATAKAAHFNVPVYQRVASRGFGSGNTMWSMSVSVPSYWRSRHYSKGRRIWYPVSDRALAVWYGDDGTLGGKGKKNPVAQFAVQKFSLKQQHKILAWFKNEFGCCSLYKTGNLSLSVKASDVFFSRIQRFLHESMEYKLPSRFRGHYDGWMSETCPQVGIVEVARKAVVDIRYENNKYCLEVKDTHSFFTRCGLVSNCSGFDNRVLQAVSEAAGQPGIYMPRGPVHDAMQMWKRWQPELPANLQYASTFCQFPFPWKHLNVDNLPFYGIADTDAALRNFHMLNRSMAQKGILQHYQEQVADLHSLPAQVAKHGVVLSRDNTFQIAKKVAAQQAELLQGMDALYPESERSYSPEEGYKKSPKEVEERRRLWNSERMGVLIGERTVLDGESEPDYVRRTTGMLERVFQVKIKQEGGQLAKVMPLDRWCKPNPFSPQSRPQIIKYAKLRKHEVPTKKKPDGTVSESLTLEDIDLMLGRTRDPFYRMIGQYRRLTEEKKLVTELELLANRSSVHSTFHLNHSGEIGSRNPSLPEPLGELGGAVVARPGYVMVMWRWEGQWERILAGLSGDPYLTNSTLALEGMWASYQKEGVHPAALRGFLRGQSDRAILEANRVVFGTSLKSIMDMRARFTLLSPRVKEWQDGVCRQAHAQLNLTSRFGEIRWFYEVYAPDGKGGLRLGEQAQSAIQFLPESDCVGIQRYRLRELGIVGAHEYIVGMGRDWIMMEVRIEEMAKKIKWLYGMLNNVPERMGVPKLPVEVWGGRDWGAMTKMVVK